MRRWQFLILLVHLPAPLWAEETPLRFKFTAGETLKYRVEQVTSATETMTDEKNKKLVSVKNVTKLSLTKLWKVKDVDPQGTATLELQLESMRLDRELPSGEIDTFDSTKTDEGSAEMRKLIGPTLAVIRIDSRGQVAEVVESKFGPASRFAADLPFKVSFGEKAVAEGTSWSRDYAIKLDPPAGTGESYASKQSYTRKPAVNGLLTLAIETEVKQPPAQPNDLIPLLPFQATGNLYFHAETGRYYGARFKTEKTVDNHQGEGSKYIYASTYVEDFVPEKK